MRQHLLPSPALGPNHPTAYSLGRYASSARDAGRYTTRSPRFPSRPSRSWTQCSNRSLSTSGTLPWYSNLRPTRVFRGPLRLTGPSGGTLLGKMPNKETIGWFCVGWGVDVDDLRSSKQNKSKQPRLLSFKFTSKPFSIIKLYQSDHKSIEGKQFVSHVLSHDPSSRLPS